MSAETAATLGLFGLLSIPISLVALYCVRRAAKAAEDSRGIAADALVVGRSQRSIQAETLLMQQRRQDDEDAPDFELTAADSPHEWVTSPDRPDRLRWSVDVRRTSGPTRVRVRWQHHAEVQGELAEVEGGGLQVAEIGMTMGGPEGPLEMVKGDRFVALVECPDDAVALTSCTVTVQSEELDPSTGEATGRKWTWSRSTTTLGR